MASGAGGVYLGIESILSQYPKINELEVSQQLGILDGLRKTLIGCQVEKNLPEQLSMVIERLKTPQPLLSLLESSSVVLTAAIRVLSHITYSPPGTSFIISKGSDSHYAARICRLLDNSNLDAVVYAARALDHIATDKQGCADIVAVGAISRLIGLFSKDGLSLDGLESAVGALCNMACHDVGCEAVISAGAIPSLIRLVEHHDPKISKTSVHALCNLLTNPALKAQALAQMEEGKLLEVIRELLKGSSITDDVRSSLKGLDRQYNIADYTKRQAEEKRTLKRRHDAVGGETKSEEAAEAASYNTALTVGAASDFKKQRVLPLPPPHEL